MGNFVLSDEEYGKVLDNIVVACVDVAVVYGNEILLENRLEDPAKGLLWIFGGRVFVGETLKQTAQRGVLRELSLDIEEDRFFEIGTYGLRWPVRREPPQQNGCHHLLVAHAVVIDDQEKRELDSHVIDNSHMRWYSLDETDNLFLSPELKQVIDTLKNMIPV